MVFIDTPLDIAMARRLLRYLTIHAEQGPGSSLEFLGSHLTSYLKGARSLFLELEEQIKGNCDVVLDGRLTVDELAAAICLRLVQLRPN